MQRTDLAGISAVLVVFVFVLIAAAMQPTPGITREQMDEWCRVQTSYAVMDADGRHEYLFGKGAAAYQDWKHINEYVLCDDGSKLSAKDGHKL